MTDLETAAPMPVDVVSDVVCPWCYIGKRRLEKALDLRPDIPVAVRWRPFLLNPWVPREGISREEYLTTKFGSVERYMRNVPRIVEAAASEGLRYAPDRIARQPNTIDCHRLIRFAESIGAAGLMKQRLMDLYFAEGADLTEREVLVGAAADCGLEADAARALLESDEGVDAIVQEAQAAADAGISGVPCFIFGNALAVSGAQAPDYLADAMGRALVRMQEGAEAGAA